MCEHKRDRRLQTHLHPELARACHGRAAHLHEEEVFRVATASDVHQLQHHGSGIGVELDKVDRLVGEAKAVDADQVFGLAQALGPHFHLPDFFEGRSGIGHSVVPRGTTVTEVLTLKDRTERVKKVDGEDKKLCEEHW